MSFLSDDISINTLIGPGAFVAGDLKVVGFIRIDGDIDGNLETSGRVIVGEKARIRGNVTSQAAIIGGVVEGDVLAPDGIQLFSTSTVIGDVITKRLQIDENALVHGQCVSVSDEAEYQEEIKNWLDTKAIMSKTLQSNLGTS